MFKIQVFVLQDNIKKMLEKAESLHRGRISTPVIKAIFSANTEDQINTAMKQLEGK
jgi:hypothetical protein